MESGEKSPFPPQGRGEGGIISRGGLEGDGREIFHFVFSGEMGVEHARPLSCMEFDQPHPLALRGQNPCFRGQTPPRPVKRGASQPAAAGPQFPSRPSPSEAQA